MERLHRILSLKRGHDSWGESQMIRRELEPYGMVAYRDDHETVLAYVLEVPTPTTLEEPRYPMLWSCHTDTVHRDASEKTEEGSKNPGIYDPVLELIYKDDNRPLGADDGAGVWLMLEMIDAGVPGTYVFHRGEECGGIGSSGLAKYHQAFVSSHKWAVAFDRKGTSSVITHQGMGRCCSDTFADALGDVLNRANRDVCLAPDATGIYTDTAEYMSLIPECTNVSVGYENEHTGGETLDTRYLFALRDAMVEAFLTCPELPVERDPSVVEPVAWGGWDFSDVRYSTPLCMTPEELVNMRFQQVVQFVKDADPSELADLLIEMAEQIVFTMTTLVDQEDACEVRAYS